MKKIIFAGTLIALSMSSFASESSIKFIKMTNYIAKNACLEDHFGQIQHMIYSKKAKLENNPTVLDEFKKKQNLIAYSNQNHVITASYDPDLKGYYLFTDSLNQDKVYSVSGKKISQLSECFAILAESKPSTEVIEEIKIIKR